jgi:haloalkane dehalogenase
VRPFDRTLYPFKSNFFDRGSGLRMHYLDEGTGPPVLMVHGNPSWSFYYRNLVTALSATHRCIVPDHIGMGMSDKPGDEAYEYTLAQRIDDLAALIDSLELTQPLTLVVHDWGGMIGFGWAVQNPERVSRLVILNTAAFPLPADKAFPGPLRLTRTPLGAFLVRGFNAFSWGATVVGCKLSKMTPAIPLSPEDPGFQRVRSIADNLHRFQSTPAMIVWGAKDFVFDDAFLRQWQAYLPQARLHREADAGHYVLEDAADTVIPLIADFIRG